jgi:hypothetical protein
MPELPILHGLKIKASHLVDSSSKFFNRIRYHTDGKSKKEETKAQAPASSFLQGKKKEPSDQMQAQTSHTVAEAAKDEGTGEVTPDVLLDVPTLQVGELKLNLDDLDAHVALQSDLGNLIRINVGVRVNIKKLDLDLKGLDAKAVLKVRLKEVNEIFSKAFESIENNPDILAALSSSVKENVNGAAYDAAKKLSEKPPENTGKNVSDISEPTKIIPDNLKNEPENTIKGHSSVKSQETRRRFRMDE